MGTVEPDNMLDVADAAMRSTAAPTYFGIYQGYVDGGVFANNPSMVALTRSISAFPTAGQKPQEKDGNEGEEMKKGRRSEKKGRRRENDDDKA